MNSANRAKDHRGAGFNPANRFETRHRVPDPEMDFEIDPEEVANPRTQFIPDLTQTAITSNDSPDIGFTHSINPYRGCEHGCIYCYARPTHEYLGFSAGIDFETRILVKERLPELLRGELQAPKWKPDVIAMSGVTDPYQPIERKLQLTRRCLAILAEFRNPVGIVTKNSLVTRDLDILLELARHQAVVVFVSLTTLDSNLRAIMEPRTSPPKARLAAIQRLSAAGVPVGVMIGPVLPGLTDHEIPALVEAAVKAGAQYAGKTILRLPLAVRPLFDDWLKRHFPDRRDKVLARIRDVRDGKLNDSNFGSRMTGQGKYADQLQQLFDVACRRQGIAGHWPSLSTTAFRRCDQNQLELF